MNAKTAQQWLTSLSSIINVQAIDQLDVDTAINFNNDVISLIETLQAENDRLRNIEEKAEYTKNWLLALCKECRYFGRYDNANVCIQAGQIECNTMEVITGLRDALKGGR